MAVRRAGWIFTMLAVWLVWTGSAEWAVAQPEEVIPDQPPQPAATTAEEDSEEDAPLPKRWSKLFSSGSNSSAGLLGEAVPPAVLLLDMSVPPGINGAAPFGESALWAPKSRVYNSTSYLSEFRQDQSIGGPLYSNDRDTLIGYLDTRATLFNTNAYLVDSKRPFPNQLWFVDAGLSFSHRSDDWTMGGGFSVSSPSDEPFHSFREVAPTANAFTRIPAAADADAWLFSVSWMPVSVIRFPLPGVAYEWNPSKELQVVAGVPFSIKWTPTQRFRFDLGYMPLYQARAQATFKLFEFVDLFAGFESLTEAYLLEDRTYARDFFYSYEKRLPAGIRFRFGEHCLLDVGGGYIFDRLYFTSSSFSDESRDRTRIAPSGFGMLRFALIF